MNGNGNEWVQDCFVDWLTGDRKTGAALPVVARQPCHWTRGDA